MASITLERVSKTFDRAHAAVRDVSLEIGDGELVVLVGPSGSGKSTLLRLIAGLEIPSGGRILIDGRDVTADPPQTRDLAMVFQSYALYPHKTVRENLAFGLRMRRIAPAEVSSRVRRVAESLQIANLLDRRPSQLSGGQRQRVALGRAIVREPKAFLLDEPLSNLDPALRLDTRAEIALLHRRLRATMIYVTHDQEEAMKLAQRLVVMREGRVEQAGPPAELYAKPANVFVGRFLGSPPMNVLDGALLGRKGKLIGIRPHDISLVRPGEGAVNGTVELVETVGSEQHVHVRLDDPAGAHPSADRSGPRSSVVVVVSPEASVQVDAPVSVELRRDRLHVFDNADRTEHPAPSTQHPAPST